ncbi:MAG: SprB repeat-containing protein [Chitinophagaceae bacterium]|nr:SprB repeat-containing protein [Chitinophagaceae bacterium]
MRKLYTPEKENCLVVDKRSQAVFSTIYRTTFLVFILFVFSLISGNLRAQSNIYESYAILNINNAGNSYYDLQATTANPDFEGADLGTFYSSNSLVLNGAQNKIYKCGTDDVIDGWFYYRIYKTTDVAPAFSAGQKIFYNMDIGASGQCSPNEVDQIWESSGAGIDVLSGLTPGTYYLEMYTTANFTYSGGSGTHYANNGGNNYKATFTVAANCINGVSISPTSLSSLCLGAASPTLTATISTQSGAGAANISYEWFSNTVNNNTTGTAISGTLLNTTTATTSSTYSPPTTVAGTVYYYCVVTNLDPTCSGSYVTDPVEVIVNSNPSVALTSQTNVLCYGASTGTIDITASGGVAPYTYAWTGTGVNPTSEDQSGLAAGTYTVVVTDANGCSTSTLTVTLTEPASPVTVALTSQTNVLCYGASTGTIDITASGGVAPYTYAWTGTGVNPTSEDQSGLAAGTYTVVVTDANGCSTSTLTVTITEPASQIAVALTTQTE